LPARLSSSRPFPTSQSYISLDNSTPAETHPCRVRSLSIVLEDADVAASDLELTSTQRERLDEILRGCNDVLEEIKKIQDGASELGSTGGSLNVRAKRQWKRLTWKPEDIAELRDRLTSNVTLLDTFRNTLSRYACLELCGLLEASETH
jgi:chaperonin cofactor prefoldin